MNESSRRPGPLTNAAANILVHSTSSAYAQRGSTVQKEATKVRHDVSRPLFLVTRFRAYAPFSDSSASTPSYSTGDGGPSNMGSASPALLCADAFALDALHASKDSLFFHTVRVL